MTLLVSLGLDSSELSIPHMSAMLFEGTEAWHLGESGGQESSRLGTVSGFWERPYTAADGALATGSKSVSGTPEAVLPGQTAPTP